MTAENIRNIRSTEQVYPSDLHVEAVVFDTGQVRLDGRADFLAEPHPGLDVAVRLDDVQLDYFKPLTNRYNLSIREGRLSLSGLVEYGPTVARLMLGRVLIERVALDYTHTPQTAKAEQARVEQTARTARQMANAPAVELRIDRLDVVKSTFGFLNRAASPPYRVALTDADIRVEHLSNQARDGRASVSLNGQLMGSGPTRLTAALQPQTGSADLDLTAQIEGADLGRLGQLVRAYSGVDVTAGQLSVFADVTIRGGTIDGYVKPLVRDVQVGTADAGPGRRHLRRHGPDRRAGARESLEGRGGHRGAAFRAGRSPARQPVENRRTPAPECLLPTHHPGLRGEAARETGLESGQDRPPGIVTPGLTRAGRAGSLGRLVGLSVGRRACRATGRASPAPAAAARRG